MRLKHRSVPSGTPPPQYCPTSYQAEHHRRKIAPLRTKQSIIIARLHLSVPSGASSSQDCTTPYQAEQSCSEPSCPVCCSRCHVWLQHRSVPSRTTIIAISDIYQQRVRTKRCGPFSIKRVINLKFSHSFCCSVAALRRCSVAVKKILFYGSKKVLYLYILL